MKTKIKINSTIKIIKIITTIINPTRKFMIRNLTLMMMKFLKMNFNSLLGIITGSTLSNLIIFLWGWVTEMPWETKRKLIISNNSRNVANMKRNDRKNYSICVKNNNSKMKFTIWTTSTEMGQSYSLEDYFKKVLDC